MSNESFGERRTQEALSEKGFRICFLFCQWAASGTAGSDGKCKEKGKKKVERWMWAGQVWSRRVTSAVCAFHESTLKWRQRNFTDLTPCQSDPSECRSRPSCRGTRRSWRQTARWRNVSESFPLEGRRGKSEQGALAPFPPFPPLPLLVAAVVRKLWATEGKRYRQQELLDRWVYSTQSVLRQGCGWSKAYFNAAPGETFREALD